MNRTSVDQRLTKFTGAPMRNLGGGIVMKSLAGPSAIEEQKQENSNIIPINNNLTNKLTQLVGK